MFFRIMTTSFGAFFIYYVGSDQLLSRLIFTRIGTQRFSIIKLQIKTSFNNKLSEFCVKFVLQFLSIFVSFIHAFYYFF